MPTKGDYRLQDDVFIAELFFEERQRLVRYAQVTLRKRGSYVDPIGRGEEIVQEAFYLACGEKRDELLQSDDPGRWLTAVVKRKIQEAVRADAKWVRNLMLLPSEEPIPFQGPDEMEEFFSKEDYELLRWVYVEGYTYKEVCEKLGISKTNLSTKLNRIKNRFKDKNEKFFK